MESQENKGAARVVERDRAMRKLRHLTGLIGVGSLAASGFLSWVFAQENPGVQTAQSPVAMAGSTGVESDDNGGGVYLNPGVPVVSTGSGPAVAVTGGSHP